MKVLIAGAGIGGLTTALCCLQRGHEVTVFERASELLEIGAGLQITPNAMKVLEWLNLAGALSEYAFRPEAIQARMGETGREIFSIPLADYALKAWGSPYLHIHRADYVRVLETALKERAPKALKLGAAVTGYAQTESAITVSLSDGRTVTGDVLIGADGIKSTVREQMLGPDAPIFTGNVAWRAVVPIEALGADAPPPTACVWMGPGRHGVTYRLRGGTLANFVGVVERGDWTGESWTEPGEKDDLLRDFQGWHPTITEIIEAAEPGSLYRWALYDRTPLKRWTDGRAALLGDAAHPMLPFLAQGAAMATEDAWVIAEQISENGRGVAASLKSYEDKRIKRTSRVQAASKANMKTFHKPTRAAQTVTYGPMWLAGKAAPIIIHRRLDWLYGYDVTR